MQANKSKLFIASLLAANAAKALNLGKERSQAPQTLAQVGASAVQAQLDFASLAQVSSTAADPNETLVEKRDREATEKVTQIFKKILDGIEEKREETLKWLGEAGEGLVDSINARADSLAASLQTLAENQLGGLDNLAVAIAATADGALADAKAEISRLKAEAADLVTEKRKEVMYVIKDLKIEIGTSFKSGVKAEKKAQIESQVSELESFINKTIREYDELVTNQINKVAAAHSAAWQALQTKQADIQDAFDASKTPAERDLDAAIANELDQLNDAYEEKKLAASEVHEYLTDNFYGYLDDLLSHVYSGASGAEKDDLIAKALETKDTFLQDVMDLNDSLEKAMTKKMQLYVTAINQVKTGRQERHRHDHKGFAMLDAEGNPIILQTEIQGWVTLIRDIEDAMLEDITTMIGMQKESNTAAVTDAGTAERSGADWLDEAATNELAILADFLAKGFAFHVDTSDFIEHTTHPYAPFSTGDYNELVDQINGFEQFFHYWKRTKERSIDVLETCKAAEKNIVSAEVFDVDVVALEKVADNLMIATMNAAENARREGATDLNDAKKAEKTARELLQAKTNKTKAKMFQEMGFMVKKLDRARREEYRHQIKEDLEGLITTFLETLNGSRTELEEIHNTAVETEAAKDDTAMNAFKSMWLDAQLQKFDEYDSEVSDTTLTKLTTFRDDVMDLKISTARAEVDAGLTNKERAIKAAYEAVKLRISKIEDHHFQYNVRSLLEDAKGEADRRCSHEDHDTNAIIDGVEAWSWDFTSESMDRYTNKVEAERQALSDGLHGASDRLWADQSEHMQKLEEHQEHESKAFEYYVEDCVKGLKHLFTRYGYVSPQFETKEHQHGTGYPHAHNKRAADLNAKEIVHTLAPDSREYRELHGTGELVDDIWADDVPSVSGLTESRSSCTGSECHDPLAFDNATAAHKTIQLDSLEDLARVIDDEVVHAGVNHQHEDPKDPEAPREYAPFISDDPEPVDPLDDTNPIKVDPISAPEKHVLPVPDYLADRVAAQYEVPEVPLFDLGYKAVLRVDREEATVAKADDGALLTPFATEITHTAVAPEPVPSAALKSSPVDDIWGSYLAKWKDDASKYEVKKPEQTWKSSSYKPFEFSNYLLGGRAPAVDEGRAPRKAYWWDQPAEAKAAGKQLAWWDKLLAAKDKKPVAKPVDVVPDLKGYGAAVVDVAPQPVIYAAPAKTHYPAPKRAYRAPPVQAYKPRYTAPSYPTYSWN